ncbi:hypothetical protein CRUP_000694 [Coryphaenoides rupestris]|nr:hypothetical protein CRUP_000694 [Coryphaenoides rupestris]
MVTDEECDRGNGTGFFNGKRRFECAPQKAMFVKLASCRPDSRFSTHPSANHSEKFANQKVAEDEASDYEDDRFTVEPISTDQVERILIGHMKGIQGHCNSCYMDAALFSLFSCSSALDSLLFKVIKPKDSKIQDTLLRHIVNPLRRRGFVKSKYIMQLRQQLNDHGYSKTFTTDEKDPEEFLTIIMQHIMTLEPLLEISAGGKVQKSYCYQIFLEQNQSLILPTVQQLLEHSFHGATLKLARVPSCLILQMPRFGKKFKMFDKIIPSLELDVTDFLTEGPQLCMLCGGIAGVECSECFQDPVFGQVGFKLFCHPCSDRVHAHPQRKAHQLGTLQLPKEFIETGAAAMPARDKLELFAVLCIETSHYVSFVKHGPTSRDWIFFDSMADREGDLDGYNIPKVQACPEVGDYLDMSPVELANQVPRDMKGVAKRLFCDAYMYLYHNHQQPLLLNTMDSKDEADCKFFIVLEKQLEYMQVNPGSLCYMSNKNYNSEMSKTKESRGLSVCCMGSPYKDRVRMSDLKPLSTEEAALLYSLEGDTDRLKWYQQGTALRTALALTVDTPVIVEGYGHGVIRYVGPIAKTGPSRSLDPISARLFGIELQGDDKGKGTGDIWMKDYFQCDKYDGIVIPFSRIQPVTATSAPLSPWKTSSQFHFSDLNRDEKVHYLKDQTHGLGTVQKSYCYQIFLEQNQSLTLPTVQQLLEHSFHEATLKLAKVPSCLILQMPRFGKKFKMFDKIIPSLELDVTDFLTEGPQLCMLCGGIAGVECSECFRDPVFGQVGFKLFCHPCSDRVHAHPQRKAHQPGTLQLPKEFIETGAAMPARDKLELFAVLCIETSHYVSFVKHGPTSRDWIFFDSMADREGGLDGYNIPKVQACPEVGDYLDMSPTELANQVPRDMKGVAKHLFCDAYMYLYHNTINSLYC